MSFWNEGDVVLKETCHRRGCAIEWEEALKESVGHGDLSMKVDLSLMEERLERSGICGGVLLNVEGMWQ